MQLIHKLLASCFQRNIFKNIITKEAINIWKNCGGGRDSANLLLTQLGLYRNGDEPFDDPYVEGTSTPINW